MFRSLQFVSNCKRHNTFHSQLGLESSCCCCFSFGRLGRNPQVRRSATCRKPRLPAPCEGAGFRFGCPPPVETGVWTPGEGPVRDLLKKSCCFRCRAADSTNLQARAAFQRVATVRRLHRSRRPARYSSRLRVVQGPNFRVLDYPLNPHLESQRPRSVGQVGGVSMALLAGSLTPVRRWLVAPRLTGPPREGGSSVGGSAFQSAGTHGHAAPGTASALEAFRLQPSDVASHQGSIEPARYHWSEPGVPLVLTRITLAAF